MGVTFVPREPGGHFCSQIQLIEGDETFQISRWKNPGLKFFCIKSISWWSVDSACLSCDSSNQLRPGRVPTLGAFAWMSLKTVWASSYIIHIISKSITKTIRSWSSQDELSWSLSGVLSPTVSTPFSSKSVQKGPLFCDPLKNSPPRDFAKVWDFSKIRWNPMCFLYLWNSKCPQCFCSPIKLADFPADAYTIFLPHPRKNP